MARAVVWVLTLVAWLAGTSAMAQPVEGTPIWRYPFAPGEKEYDLLRAVEPLADGGILAVAEVDEADDEDNLAALFRIGADGHAVATEPFHFLPRLGARIHPLTDGGAIVTDDGRKIEWVSQTGTITRETGVWKPPLSLAGDAIAVMPDGGLVVGGTQTNFGAALVRQPAVVVRLAADGSMVWRWLDPTPGWDFEACEVAALSDGGVIAYVTFALRHWPSGTGKVGSDPEGRQWLVRLTADGEEVGRLPLPHGWNVIALVPKPDGRILTVSEPTTFLDPAIDFHSFNVTEYDGLKEISRATYRFRELWPDGEGGRLDVRPAGNSVIVAVSPLLPHQSRLVRVDAAGHAEVLTPRPLKGDFPRLTADGNHIITIDGPAVMRFPLPQP